MLLEFFLHHKGKIISKTQLIHNVWGEHDTLNVSDNTISATISKVRKKLKGEFPLSARINEGFILPREAH